MPSLNSAATFPTKSSVLAAAFFGAVLLAMGVVANRFDAIIYWIPMVNSIASVAMMPESVAASPKAIVTGHLITAVVGGLAGLAFGGALGAAAISATIGIFMMMLVRLPHPPAAVSALVLVLHPASSIWHPVLIVVGALIVAAFAHFFMLMRKSQTLIS